jgi:uncharacterized protein (TIGR02145 family)
MLTAGFLLSSASAWAEDTSIDEVTITVPSSCTMTGTLNTAHTTSLLSGETANNIGTTTLKVICNDSAGYAIYAIGFTDDVYGKTVLTSSALGSSYDIATATTVTTGTSSWAMKLATSGSSYLPVIVGSTGDSEKESSTPDFSNYVAVPTEYTRVAYRNSTTDVGTGALGSSLTTTYRVYVSGTQPAGTYIGQVKYTMVHPSNAAAPIPLLRESDCPASSICYAPNASDIVGSMSTLGTTTNLTSVSPKAGKVSATSNAEIMLIAPNYSRPGYGFAGWSADFEADNSSTIYGPNETITVPDVSSHGLILYPVWIASAGNLQGWSCSNSNLTQAPTSGRATLASMTALKDTRDNNVYAVARLADGKCWMVENLRLNAENSRGTDNISKAQGYGDATANDQGKFIGLADSEDANFTASTSSTTEPTTANSIYYAGTQSGTATINIFQTDYAGFRMPRYNNNNTNMTTGATNSDGSTALTDSYNGSGNNLRWFGYGNYYSWPAAIANTAYYTTYSGTNGSDAAGTSICPKGWKLPLGYTSTGNINQGESNTANRVGSFSYLDRKLGGTGANQSSDAGTTQSKKWRSFPNNFVCSGYFGSSSADGRSSYGYYWSSSANNSNLAYGLFLDSSHVHPGTNGYYKRNGQSVRCIAQ